MRNDDEIDWTTLSLLMLLFGIIFLATGQHFSSSKEILREEFRVSEQRFLSDIEQSDESKSGLKEEKTRVFELEGILITNKENQSFTIEVKAPLLGVSSWVFLEGQVLDGEGEYLFSFGEEFWAESGYDADGRWSENLESFDVDVTLLKKGEYHLRFLLQSDIEPKAVEVIISKSKGSGLLFYVWGIILLIGGIIMNEIKNMTIIRVLSAFSDES